MYIYFLAHKIMITRMRISKLEDVAEEMTVSSVRVRV